MLRFNSRLLKVAGIRYVASDMDGTILNNQHTLSEYTKHTLFTLTQERRIPFIFATGRLHADVAVVNDHLQSFFKLVRAKKGMGEESDHTATPVYLITSNGAVAHNARTREVVMEECIAPELVRELYHLLPASETRINTNLSQRDKWYCRMDWAEVLQFHKESGLTFRVLEKLPPPRTVATVEDTKKGAPSPTEAGRIVVGARAIRDEDEPVVLTPEEGDVSKVTKVFFTCWDKPLLDKLEALLLQRYGDELCISYSASYCVEVTKKGANKANALRTVLSLLPPAVRGSVHEPLSAEGEAEVDARMAATVFAGNDMNDACALSAVGSGFLVANANPRLLADLPNLEVIASNEDDGVAKKICELFDIKVRVKKPEHE